MRVGPERIVSIRYQMRNSANELLLDTFDGEPVRFLYGSGEIQRGLEEPLEGMMKGDEKSFSVSGNEIPELTETYFFQVRIEDVTTAQQDEPKNNGTTKRNCDPDCDCWH